ncbi:hypothetical protein KCU92_g180, partial [Aureobasidium melanogenum]
MSGFLSSSLLAQLTISLACCSFPAQVKQLHLDSSSHTGSILPCSFTVRWPLPPTAIKPNTLGLESRGSSLSGLNVLPKVTSREGPPILSMSSFNVPRG